MLKLLKLREAAVLVWFKVLPHSKNVPVHFAARVPTEEKMPVYTELHWNRSLCSSWEQRYVYMVITVPFDSGGCSEMGNCLSSKMLKSIHPHGKA